MRIFLLALACLAACGLGRRNNTNDQNEGDGRHTLAQFLLANEKDTNALDKKRIAMGQLLFAYANPQMSSRAVRTTAPKMQYAQDGYGSMVPRTDPYVYGEDFLDYDGDGWYRGGYRDGYGSYLGGYGGYRSAYGGGYGSYRGGYGGRYGGGYGYGRDGGWYDSYARGYGDGYGGYGGNGGGYGYGDGTYRGRGFYEGYGRGYGGGYRLGYRGY